ncbi:rhodanese-like domain-containing protein [Thermopetrobacter sp. TC1]|uniref:rhodanese-like domain-containing protein n=1 Tax=Thermopetrobacter sp. TC1 TaxID=1495045 RepID=UPI000689C4A0|nr:rhodanese-like domain-containing protein [Thermopetrobacter sp. TC1]
MFVSGGVRIFKSVWRIIALSALFGLAAVQVQAAETRKVNIAPGMPYVDVKVGGKTIRIERIQDTKHRLTNSYTKTSRPCPPFCIQPMTAAPGVNTVGELELIDFLKKKVEKGKGVLVDARIPAWYRKGTIPGAVNIPFTLLAPDNPYRDKILLVLGAKKLEDGTWDFGGARELLLFCNGPWCGQSPRAIRNLIAAGYPPEKLHYYRGGMQSWQLLGLTTVKPQGGRK